MRDRARRAAFFLDHQPLDALPHGGDRLRHLLQHHALAAEADEQDRGEVGVLSEADQGLADPRHIHRHLAAPLVVQERRRPPHFASDPLGHLVRTDHGREHTHVVAGPRPPIRPPIPLKLHGLFSAAARSPRPRKLSMLCTWAWHPVGIACVARPMTSPYFRISPLGRSRRRPACGQRDRLADPHPPRVLLDPHDDLLARGEITKGRRHVVVRSQHHRVHRSPLPVIRSFGDGSPRSIHASCDSYHPAEIGLLDEPGSADSSAQLSCRTMRPFSMTYP